MSMNVKPKIKSVIVFPDRALVTAAVELKISPGIHDVRIDGLPLLVKKDSLRVKGFGEQPLKIHGVDINRSFFEKFPDEKVAELSVSLNQIEDELKALKDEAAVQAALSSYLDGLRDSSEQFARGLARGKSAITDQAALIEFLTNQYRDVKLALRNTEVKRRDIDDKKNRILRQLDELKSSRRKSRYVAVVKMESEGEGQAAIEVSYIISRAWWKPLYDVRLIGDNVNGEVSIAVIAEISQETGQDWKDIELTISTSRPAIAQRIPELKPHYLHKYVPPVPSPQPRVFSDRTGATADVRTELTDKSQVDYGGLEAEMVTAKREVDDALAISFIVPGRMDIPSDGMPHKRTLSLFSLQPELDYVTIPKHTAAVFRRLNFVNTTGNPLLAGKVNLFAQEEFIGSTTIDYIPVNGELELLFGQEERITVVRELTKREVEKALLRDRRKIRYGYEIEIENLMTSSVTVEVQDQIPISKHEDIKVQLDNSVPSPKEISDLNIIEWKLDLEETEKKKIIIEYVVEHPRDVEVVGLSDE